MIAAMALVVALQAPALPLPSSDKVKHFFMSAFIHSTVFSATRAAGLDKAPSQVIAGATTMVVGVAKEVYDRKTTGVFSRQDLAWDAFGSLTAAALLNGTR
jgi:uncharacterized protein YfiM (DUF2279 family)